MSNLTSIEFTATKDTYWIAHGGGGVSFGLLKEGEHLSSGQQIFETFEKNQYLQWRMRVVKLGGKPEVKTS